MLYKTWYNFFYFHRAFTNISTPAQKDHSSKSLSCRIIFYTRWRAYLGIPKRGSVVEWLRWWSKVQAFHPATNISPFSWRLIDLVQWKHVGCKYWNKGTFCRNHQLDSDRRPWRTAQLPESFSTAEMQATITQCLTLVLLNVRSKMEVHILSRWSISSWINKVTTDLCPETI